MTAEHAVCGNGPAAIPTHKSPANLPTPQPKPPKTPKKQAHIELPEIHEAMRAGRLVPDGKILTAEGQVHVTKASACSLFVSFGGCVWCIVKCACVGCGIRAW